MICGPRMTSYLCIFKYLDKLQETYGNVFGNINFANIRFERIKNERSEHLLIRRAPENDEDLFKQAWKSSI